MYPFAPVPLYRDLLDLVDQRVLVMDPTLAAVRDTRATAWLAERARPGPARGRRAQPDRRPGGLNRKQVEEALKMKVDVSIPDLPRQVGNAATLGEPVMVTSSGFRHGITDIVRQVASIRLLDGGQDGPLPMTSQVKRKMFSLFRRRA